MSNEQNETNLIEGLWSGYEATLAGIRCHQGQVSIANQTMALRQIAIAVGDQVADLIPRDSEDVGIADLIAQRDAAVMVAIAGFRVMAEALEAIEYRLNGARP